MRVGVQGMTGVYEVSRGLRLEMGERGVGSIGGISIACGSQPHVRALSTFCVSRIYTCYRERSVAGWNRELHRWGMGSWGDQG